MKLPNGIEIRDNNRQRMAGRRALTNGVLLMWAMVEVHTARAQALEEAEPADNAALAAADSAADDESGGNNGLHSVVISAHKTAVQQSREKLAEVPGTASVVDNSVVELGRASNAEDVLAFQPGVYAAATSGTEANKISIRGSGLNTFYQGYVLGIKFLYDGLPVTGPGATQEDLLDISSVNHTEILNGANAFAYTALSLGGAINFVTNNGYTAPGAYARVEGGNYGYYKAQASGGGVVGDTDYYVSAQREERDGLQSLTYERGISATLNLGHKFNEKLETRLILRYRQSESVSGGTVKLAQLNDDPTVNPAPAGRKMSDTKLIDSITRYTFDDKSQLELGLDFHDYPLWNGWLYSAQPQFWRSQDGNVTVRYLRPNDELFGRPSDTTISFSDTRAYFGDVHAYNVPTNWSLLQYTKYSGCADTVLAVGNELKLTDLLTLSTGVSATNIDRNVRILYTAQHTYNPTDYPLAVHYNRAYALPRIGLLYQLRPALQLFANGSRSVDPPVTWQMGSTGSSYVRPLVPQEGTTAEIGVRSRSDRVEGSLTVYRSWIEHELLNIIIVPAIGSTPAVTANANGTPTIHQGIETALSIKLLEADNGDNLTLRQSYTYNDFFYRHDPAFGTNELPSLPREVYQGELQYQFGGGFYAGVNLRYASSYFVDFANTWGAQPYHIWGTKLGYETPDKRFHVFVDLRNLSNRQYAAAANTIYNAHGADSANFYPGDRFTGLAGVSVRF